MLAADRLPYVDELSVTVEAGPAPSWEALTRVLEGSSSSGTARRLAQLLRCADVDASGPRPLAAGSSLPGFHVDATEPLVQLALRGSHRFSDYALIFRLDDLGGGRSRLRAETRADFPGLTGRAYRAMVIGTRGHVLATRRLLNATKRRAEKASNRAGHP